MNVPFVPVRGLLGTDYMKVRPDFRAVPNPYDPREEIALVPGIAPDVAVFHGIRGDRHGNVITSGVLDAKLIAQASRRAVATVEEVSDGDLTREPHTGVRHVHEGPRISSAFSPATDWLKPAARRRRARRAPHSTRRRA